MHKTLKISRQTENIQANQKRYTQTRRDPCKTEEIHMKQKRYTPNIRDTHKTENIHMKQESRHEKSSKPSADTFLGNLKLMQIESFKFPKS